MPSRRVFVVRVGDPNGLWATWNPNNKWSTPEVPNGQPILNAWVEGHEVHVLIVGTGDVPLHYGIVCGVRARNAAMDAAFPSQTEAGEHKTFMMFETLTSVRNLALTNSDLFQPILEEIRYLRGAQVPVTNAAANSLLLFQQGLIVGQNNPPQRTGPPVNQVYNINTTAINNTTAIPIPSAIMNS
jgi:hypothetical protein